MYFVPKPVSSLAFCDSPRGNKMLNPSHGSVALPAAIEGSAAWALNLPLGAKGGLAATISRSG